MALFADYLRERMRPAVFGPAIALLTGVALWAAQLEPTTIATALATTSWMTGLVLQFRLWDDLEDRAHDGVAHPSRVLVRAPVEPFWRGLAGLTIVNLAIALALGGWGPLVSVALLNAAGILAYRQLRPTMPVSVWQFGLVLAKYPAFVVVVAAAIGIPPIDRLIAAAIATSIAACLYEVAHTRLSSAGVAP